MQNDWLVRISENPYAYLTTMGRKSGTPHRIEIWFAASHGRVFMMAGGRDKSDWVKNLIANPAVSVEIGGEAHSGVAQTLSEGTVDDALARKLLVQKYQKKDELEKWGRTSLAVVIDFPNAGTATSPN